MARTVLRCFRCEQRYEREIDADSIAALTCADHVCPDCQTTSDTWLICPIWEIKVYRDCGHPAAGGDFPLSERGRR
jgi:hypothetical protein